MKIASDTLKGLITEVAAQSESPRIYLESTGTALWVKSASEGRYTALGVPCKGEKWGTTIDHTLLVPHLKGKTEAIITVTKTRFTVKCGRATAELSVSEGERPKEPKREDGHKVHAKSVDAIETVMARTALTDVFGVEMTSFVHLKGNKRELVCGRGDTMHVAVSRLAAKGYDDIKLDAPVAALQIGSRVARGESYVQSLQNNYQAHNEWFAIHLPAPQPEKLLGLERMEALAQTCTKSVASFRASRSDLLDLAQSCSAAAVDPFVLTIEKNGVTAKIKAEDAKVTAELEGAKTSGKGKFKMDPRLFIDLLNTAPDIKMTWHFVQNKAWCNYEDGKTTNFLCLLLSA